MGAGLSLVEDFCYRRHLDNCIGSGMGRNLIKIWWQELHDDMGQGVDTLVVLLHCEMRSDLSLLGYIYWSTYFLLKNF